MESWPCPIFQLCGSNFLRRWFRSKILTPYLLQNQFALPTLLGFCKLYLLRIIPQLRLNYGHWNQVHKYLEGDNELWLHSAHHCEIANSSGRAGGSYEKLGVQSLLELLRYVIDHNSQLFKYIFYWFSKFLFFIKIGNIFGVQLWTLPHTTSLNGSKIHHTQYLRLSAICH